MSMSNSQLWEAFIRMVDEGKLSVIVENAMPTIDGGEIVTDAGDVFDVVETFAKENQ